MFRAVAAGLAIATAVANASIQEKFDEFVKQYHRKYATTEEKAKRFEIFVSNMEAIDAMKSLDPSATHGHLTPFADWTLDEFANLNTLKVTKKVLKQHAEKVKPGLASEITLAESFDWRTKGAVTGVKNQAQCGSCWAFATVASMEGANFLKNGKLLSLSEQELVDCDNDDNGCNGGLPTNAYEDMEENKMGLVLESEYPYYAQDRMCEIKENLEKVFVANYGTVSTSETEIAQALVKYGPLAIGINATPMQFYMGGISDPAFCNPAMLDHGVTIVAYGSEDGKEFWAIKNSWGTSWGETGYYRIVRGKGACGLNRMVAYVEAAASSSEKPAVFV